MNNNIIKPKTDSVSFMKKLTEFKSQSAKEHSEFLENYHKIKQNDNEHDLNSKIIDLNKNLTDSNISSQMKPFSSIKSSVSSYLTTNFNKIFKNSNSSSDSSGIDVFENSTSPPLFNEDVYEASNREDDNKSEISTIDADDSSSYQEDMINNLAASPCQATSNRIDKIGNSFNNFTNKRATSNSIKINTRTRNNDNSSEDFTFLPDDNNIERFSVMSYEVLSKSEGIHIDYTVHFKEFIHTTLDHQKYKCANCDRKIKNSKLRCHYFGKLYCKLCHLNSKYFIPAKIISNLDIKKYPISENARHMLESVLRKPIFDIIYDNADLYSKSSLLSECKKLRLELEHVRWYLQTCKNNNAKNQFIMYLWPDDYFYETIHLYSLFDLTNLKDAFNKIKTARDYGIVHVLKDCELCKQKGFICEICKSDQTIYPFQLDSTVQCADCGSLVHKTCRETLQECLKCKRMNKRQ